MQLFFIMPSSVYFDDDDDDDKSRHCELSLAFLDFIKVVECEYLFKLIYG